MGYVLSYCETVYTQQVNVVDLLKFWHQASFLSPLVVFVKPIINQTYIKYARVIDDTILTIQVRYPFLEPLGIERRGHIMRTVHSAGAYLS